MLVALCNGEREEARKELKGMDWVYTCPGCDEPVRFKCGTVVKPHFAHITKADCWANESARHQEGKRLVAASLREIGIHVMLERTHGQDRRVDIAAAFWSPARESWIEVAIEIQDSPITWEEMLRRNLLDRKLGYAGTIWIFDSKRLKPEPKRHGEVRVPKEILRHYRDISKPVLVINPEADSLVGMAFGDVVRYSDSFYDVQLGQEVCSGTAKRLKTIKRPVTRLVDRRPVLEMNGRGSYVWTFARQDDEYV